MTFFIAFMLVATFQVSAMFYMMMRLFKFDIHWSPIVFASLLMNFISYTMRLEFHNATVDTLLQFILTIAFVWLLFRVHAVYAAIMTGLTYAFFIVIEWSCVFIMKNLGYFPNGIPDLKDPATFVMGVISSIICLIIGGLIHRKRKGFDFVPHSPTEKVNLNAKNITLLILNLPILATLMIGVQYAASAKIFFYILIPVVIAAILAAYLYISRKVDRGND